MTRHRTPARTFRATSPADLLALVPFVFGFHPEDSVVVLTTGEAAQPFHARTDLPDDPDEAAALAAHLAATAVRHRVGGVAVVLYTRDGTLAEAAAETFVACFEAAAVPVAVCLRADGARWFGLLGSAAATPGGTPYDVRSHPFTAEAVVEGRVTYASREELRASLVGTDPADLDVVGRAVGQARERLAAAGRHPLGPEDPDGLRRHLVGEGHWVVHVVRRSLAAEEPLAADEVARLAVALTAVDVRDAAWAEMDRDSADRHVRLWREVLRRCPADLRAAPAGLLAFAAWLAGDGALAWCAVDRCLETDPGYRLGVLVGEALAGAVPPSTWRQMDRSALPLFAG